MVRPGELSAYARRMRILLLLFLAAYLGTILRFPQSLHTEPSVPGIMASRAEAGSVCRSHLRVQLLSWLLRFLQCLVCSGALEGGGPDLSLAAQHCPRWLPGKPGHGLELLF